MLGFWMRYYFLAPPWWPINPVVGSTTNILLHQLSTILLLTRYTDQKPSLIVYLGHAGLGSTDLGRDVLHRSEQQVAQSLEHGCLEGQRAGCWDILRESCLGICLEKDADLQLILLMVFCGRFEEPARCLIGVFYLSSPCWWKEPWKSWLTLEVQVYSLFITAKACRRQRRKKQKNYINTAKNITHMNFNVKLVSFKLGKHHYCLM